MRPVTHHIDCKWSYWGQCSATCGVGKQERNIRILASNGGRSCKGERTKKCNQKPCPGNLLGLKPFQKWLDFIHPTINDSIPPKIFC